MTEEKTPESQEPTGNSCKTHYGFTGDLCPVCIMEELEAAQRDLGEKSREHSADLERVRNLELTNAILCRELLSLFDGLRARGEQPNDEFAMFQMLIRENRAQRDVIRKVVDHFDGINVDGRRREGDMKPEENMDRLLSMLRAMRP